MSKQIKIGLDKLPAPLTKQYTQLIDLEGLPLRDAAGNPLVSEGTGSLGIFNSAQNALSTYVNAEKETALPIVEQFPEVSAVSSSLLGVPRAEEQLSLFSDVATYGLDEDAWNQYTFTQTSNIPPEWYKKKHPIYGRRENPSFNEGSEEQALYLRNFSTQYSFPTGTIANRKTTPTPAFRKYINFILMGKYLYGIFNSYPSTQVFAKKYLLDNDVYFLTPDNETDEKSISFDTVSRVFDGQQDFHDVGYGNYNGTGVLTNDIQSVFDKIEAWTYLFGLIQDGTAQFPNLPAINAQNITGRFVDSDLYKAIKVFCVPINCVPGGISDLVKIAVLESKDTFRYQPGRVSGFTFGTRLENDSSSNANYLEFGASNDTDEYMFQLRGSEFNIVRRSTLPLGGALLERQGLPATAETLTRQKGLGSSENLYETIIPRSRFNGDALSGNGKSGYVLTFEDVTMYKIEFSWYGAIGAKFYAYVPIGPGECRWVLIHRLVIENGMGKPVLKNPDLKFKYIVYSGDSAGLTKPSFLYKYGSSYYIDGGDEGTNTLTTISSNSKSFASTGTPIIGVKPKNVIFNSDISYTGDGVTNYKKIYPLTISASSDEDCRIDIMQVAGSPDGAHYCYQPSIHNGKHGLSRENLTFKWSTDGTSLTLQDATFNASDKNAKVIGDGIYGVYVNGELGSDTSTIYRRNNATGPSYLSLITGGAGRLGSVKSYTSYDGQTLTQTINEPTFTGRLSNYHAVAASTTPINASKFKIHFLNPRAKDAASTKHFAEFAVGVTPHKPKLVNAAGVDRLKFEIDAATESTSAIDQDFDLYEYPYVEYAHNAVRYWIRDNSDAYEDDIGYGDQMSVDPRIPNPEGSDSGYISTVQGTVDSIDYIVTTSTKVDDASSIYDNKYKIEFNSDPNLGTTATPTGIIVPTNFAEGISELGVNGASLDPRVYFISEVTPAAGVTPAFAYVSTAAADSADPFASLSSSGNVFQPVVFETTIVSATQTDDNLVTIVTSADHGLPYIKPSGGGVALFKLTGFEDGIISVNGVGTSYSINSDIEVMAASVDSRTFRIVGPVISGLPIGSYEGIIGNTYPSGSAKLTQTRFVSESADTLPITIQSKVLTLSDDFKVEGYDNQDPPERMFGNRSFSKVQALAFDDAPLYLFFALKDYAKVNNISVEEIYPTGTVAHTPQFIKDASADNSSLDVAVSSGTALASKSPASFNEESNLSPTLFDLTTLNPLRPGNRIYSFYAAAGKPTQLDLQSIFGVDRKKISRGLYNNLATYFTATKLTAGNGNIEMTLTVKEQ